MTTVSERSMVERISTTRWDGMNLRAIGATTALAVTLAACGGIGIPQQQPGETYPGDRHDVTGTIEIDSYGCIRVALAGGGSYPVIWPASASQGADDYVNLGWFQADLGNGDRVRGTAALTPLASLPHWGSMNYWQDALGACIADGVTEALVFDSASGIEK
jgi:hypothetical protein